MKLEDICEFGIENDCGIDNNRCYCNDNFYKCAKYINTILEQKKDLKIEEYGGFEIK